MRCDLALCDRKTASLVWNNLTFKQRQDVLDIAFEHESDWTGIGEANQKHAASLSFSRVIEWLGVNRDEGYENLCNAIVRSFD